jgi:hypothetical protein
MRASFSINALGCHAPLQAGHPVITPRQGEATASKSRGSVVTGSSAYADDDDREYANAPVRLMS